MRGANRLTPPGVDHADAKQGVEAYLQARDLRATVLGPACFIENALNLGFSQLGNGVLAVPLSPDTRLDQVTVLDIAGMTVYSMMDPASGPRREL